MDNIEQEQIGGQEIGFTFSGNKVPLAILGSILVVVLTLIVGGAIWVKKIEHQVNLTRLNDNKMLEIVQDWKFHNVEVNRVIEKVEKITKSLDKIEKRISDMEFILQDIWRMQRMVSAHEDILQQMSIHINVHRDEYHALEEKVRVLETKQ